MQPATPSEALQATQIAPQPTRVKARPPPLLQRPSLHLHAPLRASLGSRQKLLTQHVTLKTHTRDALLQWYTRLHFTCRRLSQSTAGHSPAKWEKNEIFNSCGTLLSAGMTNTNTKHKGTQGKAPCINLSDKDSNTTLCVIHLVSSNPCQEGYAYINAALHHFPLNKLCTINKNVDLK